MHLYNKYKQLHMYHLLYCLHKDTHYIDDVPEISEAFYFSFGEKAPRSFVDHGLPVSEKLTALKTQRQSPHNLFSDSRPTVPHAVQGQHH
jgi:hypothetical protein